MPFDLERIISFKLWRHGEIICQVWTTTYLLAVPTSILSLLALAVYRYRLLKDPLDIYKSSPLMTRRRAFIVVCCLWAYSTLFSLAPVFGWKRNPRSVNHGYCHFNVSLIYSVLSSMINFVTPVIIASFLNCKMFCLATKRLQPPKAGRRNGKIQQNPTRPSPVQDGANSPPTEQQVIESMRSQHEAILIRKLQRRNTRAAAKTTFLIVFSFVVCWLPFSFLSIIATLCLTCARKNPSFLMEIFLMMGYLNSAINPVLYSFRSSEFKKAVKDFIRKKRLFRVDQIRTKNTYAIERRTPTLQNIPSTDDFGVNLKFYNRFDSAKGSCEVNL
ncbi:5-hydroxytryptamine receptor 2A-like [Stylophora pistillata]|uniref:5-hydroxytryptamine receptor 2A-like n=1 Tax=Stylophora pistillata TaxID=50429 RepID=UPI000C0394CA|nr:5-hydroxytryptamine receptor 2A-like [Stylophora pistillata]